jgi:predicted nucleic acid-binding protein
MTIVLDASALIALLIGEPGWEKVACVIAEPAMEVAIHAINMCEVWTDLRKRRDTIDIEAVAERLDRLALEVRRDLDDELCHTVAARKARGGLSLADCFGVALAARLSAPFYTSDHKELDAVAAEGTVQVVSIR